MPPFDINPAYSIDVPIVKVGPNFKAKRSLLIHDRTIGPPGSMQRAEYRQTLQQKLDRLGLPPRKQWLRALSPEASLELLKQQMMPNSNYTSSAIFVCLDFGRYDDGKSNVNEIGIATLDIAKMNENKTSSPCPITSQNHIYYTPSYYKFRTSESDKVVHSDGFTWGITKHASRDEMKDLLEGTIKQVSRNGEQRDAILVFHYAYSEITVLQHMGIDLLDREQYPNFLGVIDTDILACCVIPRVDGILDSYHRFSLDHLVEHLRIPYWKLHISGNDAKATLKALILLACLQFRNHGLAPTQKETLLRLISVAKEPLPAMFRDSWKYGLSKCSTRAGYQRHRKQDWADHLNGDGSGLCILDNFEWTPMEEKEVAADWAEEFEDDEMSIFGIMDN